jgi:hypothetical protein
MITPEQLDLHAKWLRNEDDGVRLCARDANLQGAYLAGANLQGADLCGVDLCGANLCGAGLRGAELGGANLCGADLCGANLRDADLRDADLRGANLCGADLCGAAGIAIAADAPERLRAVAQAALKDGALEMNEWHTCERTHCMAGWALHQAGEPGRLLEQAMGSQIAGLMLLGVDAHSHFFDSNEEATAYLHSVLEGSNG